MLVVTGAAGFIGSALTRRLDQSGREPLALVDRMGQAQKWKNLLGLRHFDFWDRDGLFERLDALPEPPRAVVHLGACTDTAETDVDYLMRVNYAFSCRTWNWCVENGVPLVYASSAATYGDGRQGYSDNHDALPCLRPLNAYGFSKHAFDLFALAQARTPPAWHGLKFFNVFGWGESHKGRMASVAFHGYEQIRRAGWLTLFRSHREGIADGEQRRDFVYVDDAVRVLEFFLEGKAPSGIYNCGSGKAETFLALAAALFAALDRPQRIEWVDTPPEIRESYQYLTEADLTKLRGAGYRKPMTSLERGVARYVEQLERVG